MNGSKRPENRFGHAVVAGASMAGLLAARVLAEYFEQVTVVERDQLPRGPEARKGVPQARHVHLRLQRGSAILQDLFPSLTDELLQAGAHRIRAGLELAWYHAEGWRVPHDSNLRLLAMSRPLLEAHVVARVRALCNVTVLEGARAEALATGGEGQVNGLVVHEAGGARTLQADLVVDALGRGSPGPEWLRNLGYGPIQTDHVPARVT